MSDLREFARDYSERVVPPRIEDLARVAERRRRRGIAVAATAAIVAIATIALTLPGQRDLGKQQVPANSTTTRPSPLSTAEIRDLVQSKSLEDVAEEGEIVRLVPGDEGAELREYTLCLNLFGQPVSVKRGFSSPSYACRGVFAFHLPGGDPVLLALAEASAEGHDYPVHVGGGVFVNPGYDGKAPELMSAGMTEPVRLKQGHTPGDPAPGRYVVWCFTDETPNYGVSSLCTVDVKEQRIDLMTTAALPRWLDQVRLQGKIDQVQLVDIGDGLVYVPNGLQPDRPVLVSSAMASAQPLTVLEKRVEPHDGMRWVRCPQVSPVVTPGAMCEVDVERMTLAPVNICADILWQPDTTGGYWGAGEADAKCDHVISGGTTAAWWLDERGRPQFKEVTGPGRSLLPAKGVATGAMTFYDIRSDLDLRHLAAAQPAASVEDVLLHVSTDRGRTWRVLQVPPSLTWDELNRQRLPVGWQDWSVAG